MLNRFYIKKTSKNHRSNSYTLVIESGINFKGKIKVSVTLTKILKDLKIFNFLKIVIIIEFKLKN